MSFDAFTYASTKKFKDAAALSASTATAQAALAQGYAAQLAAGLLRPKGTYADLAALNAGTPTVADTDEIYITLNDGKWCYHNGTAWIAGGQFQAASVAADLERISNYLDGGEYLAIFTPESGYVTSDSINVSGEVLTATASSQYLATDFIPLDHLVSISIKSNDYISRIIKYDDSKTRLGYVKTQTNGIYTHNIAPAAGVAYCRVLLWNNSYTGFSKATANGVWEFTRKVVYDYIDSINNKTVTPEMFGAVGDGVSDDTAAVQSAVDSGKMVLLISTYAISDPVYLKHATHIEGATTSKGLLQTDPSKDILVINRQYQQEFYGLQIKNMSLRWDGVAEADTVGIHFMQTYATDGWGTHDSYVENVRITFPYFGVKFDDNEPSWNNKIDVFCYGSQYQALRIKSGFGNDVNIKALGATNNVSVTRSWCIYMYAGGKMRIDVEDWKNGIMITESVSAPIIIDLIHLERCDRYNGGAYFQFSSTPVAIRLLEAYNCQAHGANACMFLLFGTSKDYGGCILEVDIVSLYDFTIDNTFYLVNNVGTATTLCHIKSVQKSGTVNLNGIYFPYSSAESKENCYYKYSPIIP